MSMSWTLFRYLTDINSFNHNNPLKVGFILFSTHYRQGN